MAALAMALIKFDTEKTTAVQDDRDYGEDYSRDKETFGTERLGAPAHV